MSEPGITLSPAELVAITGYELPCKQLGVLHKRGFHRAYIPKGGGGVVLERAHYEAVCERNANPPVPESVWREEKPARVYEGSPLQAAHQRQRLAAQERREVEEENRLAWEAELERTRPEREAQAELQHAALIRHHAAKRRVEKLKRTPPWADQGAIKAVYDEALRLTRETGVKHHVDHEIPLQGVLVSGLHVHQNLRAIPASENVRKHNHYEVA